MYSITSQNGRRKFCTSEHLLLLAGEAELGAGGAEELHCVGLHTWTCDCSAAWLLATGSAGTACPVPCAASTAPPPCVTQGWEAAELSLGMQQVSTAPLGQHSAAS